MTVMRVAVENVMPLWPQLEPLLGAALRDVSTHEPEDVRRGLLAMQAQLWAQMDADTLEAAVTTEFVSYPKGVFVRAWHAGARRDRRMDDAGFFDALDRWRQANGCIGFEAVGRYGWLRRFPDARVEGLVMRWMP